jgi:S1-C subfamily serine protease
MRYVTAIRGGRKKKWRTVLDPVGKGIVAFLLLISYNGASMATKYIVGTGFMISPNGLILTNRHVVEDCVGPIEARYIASGVSRAVIIAKGKTLDLALLATGFRDVPYLHLRENEGKVSLPVRDEFVHTLGFIENVFSPRGGTVTDTSDPALAKLTGKPILVDAGAIIGLNSGHGASGSPVVDDTGLLIGIIWGGPVGTPDYATPHMFNGAAIYSFLSANQIPVPMADTGPYSRSSKVKSSHPAWDHIVQIEGFLSETTVRIACPAG